MKIKIKKDIKSQFETIETEKDITLEKLAGSIKRDVPYMILAAKVDNKVKRLTEKIAGPCEIEFLDMRTRQAHLIYQYSVTLLYLAAVKEVLETTDTEVRNSLNQGLFTLIRTKRPLIASDVKAVEKRMRQMVREDIPIESLGACKKEELKQMQLYKIKDYEQFFYGLTVPSSGYLKYFRLKKYKRGVILRFPQPSIPDKMPPYVDNKKMYYAFAEEKKWKRVLGISVVWDLNIKIIGGEPGEIIQMSEALHDKRIVEIAGEIAKLKKRVILIAGPSSSGKKTFARRLCIQLKVNGSKPLYLGTDDYFLDRKDTPKDENGEPNFEDLEALDIDLFNRDMNMLLEGKEADIPEFDFLQGKKIFGKRRISIDHTQPIVIEGIHALNDELTPYIDEKRKFKIYISPLTQLNIDDHNVISTTDSRMIRRMVRDHQYRGHSAEATIKSWPKVRAGEDKNIFPYNSSADAFFNSVHIYELGVLKKYAEPMLKEVGEDRPEYSEAVRMLKFLSFFKSIEDDSMIANNSILREFIGGSVFHQ